MVQTVSVERQTLGVKRKYLPYVISIERGSFLVDVLSIFYTGKPEAGLVICQYLAQIGKNVLGYRLKFCGLFSRSAKHSSKQTARQTANRAFAPDR